MTATDRSAGWWRRGRAPDTASGCASGAPSGARAPVSSTGRSSPPTILERRLSGSTEAAKRVGGWAARLIICGTFLAAALPLSHLAAQSVLAQFSYDSLRPSGLQADLGALGASRLRGTI